MSGRKRFTVLKEVMPNGHPKFVKSLWGPATLNSKDLKPGKRYMLITFTHNKKSQKKKWAEKCTIQETKSREEVRLFLWIKWILKVYSIITIVSELTPTRKHKVFTSGKGEGRKIRSRKRWVLALSSDSVKHLFKQCVGIGVVINELNKVFNIFVCGVHVVVRERKRI